jgi:AraC-like DNA-binding protein
MPFGRAGALSYAIHSAATMREALEVSARYARLFCDAASINLEVEGKRAILRFASTVPLPTAIADFAMACWYPRLAGGSPGDGRGLECWFAFPKPQNATEYERTFDRAGMRFDAPFDGFTFAADCLDAPLASADSTVHVLLCEHLALTMDHLSRRRTFAGSVRDIAMRELLHATPSASSIAGQLRMSKRTLGRRLEREGTTFSCVLDHLRQELALRYVGTHDIALGEISSRLKFSHPEAFYRAFKRWTGQTPFAYRRARRL